MRPSSAEAGRHAAIESEATGLTVILGKAGMVAHAEDAARIVTAKLIGSSRSHWNKQHTIGANGGNGPS